MKNLKSSSLIAILCISFAYSQGDPFRLNIGISQDVKMSYEGPHKNGGMLNPEASLEIEWETVKVFTAYEWLSQIEYRKWSGGVDWALIKFTFCRDTEVNMYLGPEVSVIYRGSTNRDYKNETNYQQVKSFYSYGGNATIDWRISDLITLVANTNVFKAEPYDNFGNSMKEWRTDVRLGIKLTLINTH